MLKEQILFLFCGKIRQSLENTSLDFRKFQEIRLRIGKPVILIGEQREFYLREQGGLTERWEEGLCAEGKDLRQVVETACGYSGYAYEEEIRRGYLTIFGGHRIGIVGRAVLNENGVQTLKQISALNLRIAHPIMGCAELWSRFFYQEKKPCHVLLISSPGGGKTTLLRDAVRMFSNGIGEMPPVTVGVVDERSEIAGTYRGDASFDLGIRTDVLDGCPKRIGMEMMLRSMSPKVLAVDEIGTEDVPAIEHALRCGSKVLATLHGDCLEDFLEKPGFTELVREQVFERYFLLKQGNVPGKVTGVYGQKFESLWKEELCISKS